MSNRTLLMLAIGDPATDRRSGNFQHFFDANGWTVERLSVPPLAPKGPKQFFEYHHKLGLSVRSKSAYAVMACDLYSLSAAAWMKRHGHVQYVCYDSREVYTELPRVASRPFVKLAWRTLERRGLLATDLIVVTAPRDAQEVCDVHDFLPPSVLVRNLPLLVRSLPSERSVLQPFNIPDETPIAVYLGGIQRGRGLEHLVEVFRAMPEKHLLLIGDGELRSKLQAIAPSNVHILGAIPSDQAMKVAAACNVGIALVEPVSKSYELALPSKLFEYMMCGIPVVSSKLGQVVDLFRKESWISFVDESDPNSIRAGIDQAFGNSGDPEMRGRERSLALSEYHFEHDAAKLLGRLEKFSK